MTNKLISRRKFFQQMATATGAVVLTACAAPTAIPSAPTTPAEATKPAAAAPTTPPPAAAPTTPPAVAPTTPPPAAYKESPMLAELVKAGKLPPVEERLPLNPKLVNEFPESQLKL